MGSCVAGSLAAGETLEAEMDQHNNAIGREIGTHLSHQGETSRREIADSVKKALDKGSLKVIDRDGGEATLVSSGAARRN